MSIAPLRPDSALFLDFDGTLVRLQDDPDTVWLPADGAGILCALKERLGGALAILSGRDMRDLAIRTPPDLWRIGGHGLEVLSPGETPHANSAAAPQILADRLAGLAANNPGTRLEVKGPVLALHYRAAAHIGAALAEAAANIIAQEDDYIMQHGKMVIEAKPAAANKGVALKTLMQLPPFAKRTPVIVGDDVTDEDAMIEALRMGGGAVKVGDGETNAPMRLVDPGAVWRWLKISVDA